MRGPGRSRLSFNGHDGIPGLLFVAAGLYFAIESILHLTGPSSGQIGAATFPTILGFVLAAFGLVLLVRATRTATEPIALLPFRRMLPVLMAPLFFGLTVRGGGMAFSLLGAVAIATLARPDMRLRVRLGVIGLITALCVAVFIYGVGLPFEVVGPWFGS